MSTPTNRDYSNSTHTYLNVIDSFLLYGFFTNAPSESLSTSRLKNIDNTLYSLGVRSFADTLNLLRTEFIALKITPDLTPVDTLKLSHTSLNFDIQDGVSKSGDQIYIKEIPSETYILNITVESAIGFSSSLIVE